MPILGRLSAANNQVGQDEVLQLLPHLFSHLCKLDRDAKAGAPTGYNALHGKLVVVCPNYNLQPTLVTGQGKPSSHGTELSCSCSSKR
jgi:hypothetical protein